jgi:probable rRNA maturation factor
MRVDGSLSRRRLRVHVVDSAGRALPARGLARWLERLAPRRAAGTVTVAIVSDQTSRSLNRSYRGFDRATDVLSFPSASTPRHRALRTSARRTVAPGHLAPHLGDVVIARGVARRQARSIGPAETTEWRVLALHGLLHLMGYDHEQDAGRMERVERRLRQAGGLGTGLIEREQRR